MPENDADWDYDPELGFVNRRSGESIADLPVGLAGSEQVGGGALAHPLSPPVDAEKPLPPAPSMPAAAQRFLDAAPREPRPLPPDTWDPYTTPMLFGRMFWALLDVGYARDGPRRRFWEEAYKDAVADFMRDRDRCAAEQAAAENFLGIVIWETNMAVSFSASDRGRTFNVYPYAWPSIDGTTGIQNKPKDPPVTYFAPPRVKVAPQNAKNHLHPAARQMARLTAPPAAHPAKPAAARPLPAEKSGQLFAGHDRAPHSRH